MNTLRRAEIEQLADRVRGALDLGAAPYNVHEAVRRLRGCVNEDAALKFEAQVRKSLEEPFVFAIDLVPGHSERRKRFSIAHELGHLFLHMGFITDSAKWDASSAYIDSPMHRYGHTQEEYEAHAFAASFLMPRAEFREVARAHLENSKYKIQPIADHFEVSPAAARNRGRWLGLFAWD